MDPSQENRQDTPPAAQKTSFVPAILVLLLLMAITGLGFSFYSGSLPIALNLDTAPPPRLIPPVEPQKTALITTPAIQTTPEIVTTVDQPRLRQGSLPAAPLPSLSTPQENSQQKAQGTDIPNLQQDETLPASAPDVMPPAQTPKGPVESVCKAAERRLYTFYSSLDKQPYMSQYHLSGSSEQHFTALIHKLLNNPPQVTRESDDLYTILKNTAHFFRISGKDNVFMMKGILGNEKQHIEQILADYNLLISTPECSTSPQVTNMDQEALYEYACFFLNTMGGRLYLFRRDSLSRMVVTYYAILLVDRANQQNNNRYGLDLKSSVDMLIAEMESGGSSLRYQDRYLDSLYLMKEKYQ